MVPSASLVPGDLVALEAGDLVPADLRLLESYDLAAEESALTENRVPVEKEGLCSGATGCGPRGPAEYAFPREQHIRRTGERRRRWYRNGHANGTYCGMINREEAPQTPLQKRLAQTGKILGIGAILICAVIFVLGLLQKTDPLEMFMMSVSLAVAAIPEGLPAVVTIVLAVGVRRMAAHHTVSAGFRQ